MRKSFILIATLLMVVLFSFAAFATNQANDNLKKVRLQLKWKHQFQFAGYIAAIEKGYYKEQGLQVELIEAVTGEQPGLSVFNGKADFGISTSDVVLMREEGYDPVILATIFQHSAQVLITSTASGIENMQQLIGKKIALEPHAADLIAFMNDEGVELEQCTILNHYFSPDQLINGDVDAITGYLSDEPFLLDQNGFEYRVISPQMGGIDFYGDLLFCSESFLRANPELVKAFVTASLKGWSYALDNTDELVQIIFNKYSKRHSIEHLQYEAVHTRKLIMPDVLEIGYSNPGRWESIVEIYKRTSLLNNESTLRGLFYKNYQQKHIKIPWKVLGVLSLLLIIVGGISIFYFRLNIKLKKQISLIKEMENELRDSENMLASIIQHLPGMIFRCKNDENWTMEYLNENCFELTAYKADEIIGNKVVSYNQLIYPDDREKVNEQVQKGLDNHKNYEVKYRIVTGDKEIKWVWEKGNGHFSIDNKLLYVEGLIMDITKQVIAEKELNNYRENLEEMVNARTLELQTKNEELEKYNELFVGREFRIKELKEKLKAYENKDKGNEG